MNQLEGLTVRQRLGCAVLALVFAASLQGQQSQGQPPPSPQAQSQQKLLEIYRIDLDPTGSAFALTKPVLEGDVYTFLAWPDRAPVRLKQTRVKKITMLTKDLNKESVYQIDLVPSGRMLTREQPKVQGGNYLFHAYKGGALMSLKKTDVKKITHLTGLPAFRVQQEELGAALIGDLPMEGGGTVRVIPSQAGAPAQPAQAPVQGQSQGTGNYPAGVSEAFPGASATVESPGDVPKAPSPAPKPH